MMDSADHCFIDYNDFVKYEKFQISLVSRIAKKRTDFEIVGWKVIRLAVEMTDRRIIYLILHDVLYIPGLYSNLILIPKICSLGLAVIFSKNNVITSFSDERMIIHRVWYEKLYHVKTVGEPKVFIVS